MVVVLLAMDFWNCRVRAPTYYPFSAQVLTLSTERVWANARRPALLEPGIIFQRTVL